MLLDYSKRKDSMLWKILILSWIIWGGISICLSIYFSKNPENNVKIFEHKSLGTLVGLLIGFALIFLYRYIKKRFAFISTTVLILPLIIISACIWSVIHNIINWVVWNTEVLTLWSIKNWFAVFNFCLIYLAFTALYFLITYWQQYQSQKEKTLKATALAQKAQLQMLQYQLNPHFLFNALNSVRAMINEDRKRAREMITELSEFLRYSLVKGKKNDVTLSDEIEAIQNYLDIQKIRFEDRLDVKLEIEPSAGSYNIPCFLIHPLVENAVKYGMQTSSMPLRIRIIATVKDNLLSIKVSNTGKFVKDSSKSVYQSDGTGTGLENIKQRLNHLFPNQFTFDLFEADGWVHAKMEINVKAFRQDETV